MYVKEMNCTNYIAATQHSYSKEIMDAEEVTNSVTICTTTEGNYTVFFTIHYCISYMLY